MHLVRNPFDNLVARFHLELKTQKGRGKKEWVVKYPNTADGFRLWCADEDVRYANATEAEDWSRYGRWKEDDGMGGGRDGNNEFLPKFFEGVTCRHEFFKYAQWHSLATGLIENMNLTVLEIHYEDYVRDLEGTADVLLEFLNLRRAEGASVPEFQTGKNYTAYFTTEERVAASELMRRVVMATGVEGGSRRIERYFVK